MLSTKYQQNRLSGPGEEVVRMFVPYMGIMAIWNFES